MRFSNSVNRPQVSNVAPQTFPAFNDMVSMQPAGSTHMNVQPLVAPPTATYKPANSTFSVAEQPAYKYWGGDVPNGPWQAVDWSGPTVFSAPVWHQPLPGAAGFWSDQTQQSPRHGAAIYTTQGMPNTANEPEIENDMGPAGDAVTPNAPTASPILTATSVLSVPLRCVNKTVRSGSVWLHVVAQMGALEEASATARSSCRFQLRDPDGSQLSCVYYAQDRAMPELLAGRWVYCVGRLDLQGVYVCVNVRPGNRRDIGMHRQLSQLSKAVMPTQ